MSNICFVIYDFTKKGGAERATAKLSNELVGIHNVTIISVFNDYSDLAYELDRNVEVEKIFDSSEHILRNITPITRKIVNVLNRNEIDVVLSIDIATALMAVLAAKIKRVKLIVCDRSSCYNKTMYSKLNLRIYAWLGIHMADIYQVMTEDGRKGCIEKYRVNASKIVVIPNWIDEKAIVNCNYSYCNKKIISVGRATPEKNYEELIKIAKKIKKYCPGWEWHIWGDFTSEYGKQLLEMIHDNELGDFLIHKGTTDRIYDVYQNYSFFVITSQFEGMPNVILEAQGSKLPVIAYDCKTGPAELVHNEKNGFLIPLNNTSQMCDAIRRLVEEKNLAEKLSSYSNINYKKYSKKTVLMKWDKILKGEKDD